MQELLRVGPFGGLNTSTEPYYLTPEQASQVSNVDVSYRLGAFSTAFGRDILGEITLSPGYALTAAAEFRAFYGEPPASKRLIIFSSSNGSTSIQGYYDTDTNVTTTLPNASAFASAVQFGASLYTDGGDRIFYLSGVLASDTWQIQVPYPYSYNVQGTYATVSGNAPLDTYTYAITLRKAQSPWQTSGSAPDTIYSPDLESLQESSPVFSTSVMVTAGQQPGFTVPSSLSLPNLVSGLTTGGEQYYGCLYRFRILNPVYTFVDYLANIGVTTDHNGDPAIIDTYSDDKIADNATLIFHRDPPPIIGQTYPGAIANNSSSTSLQESSQQVSFTYTNPAFLCSHKGRMWVFTLYPAEPVGSSPVVIPDELTLQPQVWCSDYNVPWQFNDDSANNQVLLVGPEDTPGNGSVTASIATNPPWTPGALDDTPMGMASTGSYLVLFKSQRTYIVLGDTPSEFIVQQGFDIGCVSSKSVAPAEGGIFWLAPQGAYFFNGGSPEYISEDIRGTLDGLPWANLQGAIGSYRDKTYYLSVPESSITFCYYIPTKKWYTLPYACTAALYSPANRNSLLFLNPATNASQVQAVDTNPGLDLGQPITATWNMGVTDSKVPGQLKAYTYLQIVASVQPGTIIAQLHLDEGSAIPTTYEVHFDAAQGNGAHVAKLPQAMRGYEARLTVSVTTDANATAPIVIRSAVVSGEVVHTLQAPQTTDITKATLNGAQVYPIV